MCHEDQTSLDHRGEDVEQETGDGPRDDLASGGRRVTSVLLAAMGSNTFWLPQIEEQVDHLHGEIASSSDLIDLLLMSSGTQPNKETCPRMDMVASFIMPKSWK